MTTDSWSLDAAGQWTSAADWSERHIPLSGENVVIDTTDPHAITFAAANSLINSLSVGDDTLIVASGALTIAGAASFGGLLEIAGGTLDFEAAATTIGAFEQTGGALDVQSGTLSFDGASDSFGGIVEGAGALAIDGGATNIAAGAALKIAHLGVSGGATRVAVAANETYDGAFTLSGGATIRLTGGGLALAGTAKFAGGTVDGVSSLITEGTTTVSGLTIGGTARWANSGTVTQSGGTVTIGDASGATAILDNTATGTYIIADDSDIDRGAGAGSLILNVGMFAKTSPENTSVIKVDFISTGTVAQAGGDLEFDGAHNSLSGTYIGPGMIDYGPDGVSTLGNLNITQSACGTNFGIVDVTGPVTIADGSTLVNDATWNFVGDFGIALAVGSSTPLFTNNGVMAKTAGAGTSVVAMDIINNATVRVATGTLAFDGGSNTLSGAIVGAGAFALGGGETTIEAGATISTAKWSVAGAVTLDDQLSYAGVFDLGSGSFVSVSTGDDLALQGSATCTDATVDGPGHLYTEGTTTVSGLTVGGGVAWVNIGTVDQIGNVNIGDTSGGTGLLYNRAGATYDILDDGDVTLGSSAASYISNAGLFEKTAGSAGSTVAAKIVNAGTVSATSGTLDLQGALAGTGRDTVGAGAVLEVGGVVGAGQTLAFSGSGGEISLADLESAGPQLFHGSISGFGAGDTIDIGAATYGGFQENAGHTAGVMNLTEGTASASINFVGDYAPSNFVPNVVAGSPTLITFKA